MKGNRLMSRAGRVKGPDAGRRRAGRRNPIRTTDLRRDGPPSHLRPALLPVGADDQAALGVAGPTVGPGEDLHPLQGTERRPLERAGDGEEGPVALVPEA